MKPATGRAVAVAACLLLAACGGGGGDGPAPAPPAPAPDPDPAPMPGPGEVLISGTVTYDSVPHRIGAPPSGLDYSQTETRPVRLATVQFVDGSTVLASTQTDLDGDYSLIVDENRSGFVRVRAESVRAGTPSWDFRVVDNTSGNALYTLDGAVASSGTANSERDLHADSGWSGAGYDSERAAAPFAILDTIHDGAAFLAVTDPTIDFPPLAIHWSPDNRPAFDADGNPDPETGEIGTSLYSVNSTLGMNGIYLLGAEDEDTEEYDRHVIVHEFAHYLEREFARNDSIGGPHALTDRLDMRVAFSEGWATAFAALALGDPDYRDSQGSLQQFAFRFDVESAGTNSRRGWYSEQSVLELVYDLVDSGPDAGDGLIYPFAVVWDAMTGGVGATPALTSIFPFYAAVKEARPGDGPLLDQLAAGQEIASVSGDFGAGETNDANGPDVLPVYTAVTVNGPAVNICSSDAHTSTATGATNKLASRRYLRFTPQAPGSVTITVRATSIPAGKFADPDFWIHRGGPFSTADGAPSAACEDVGGIGWEPGDCLEAANLSLPAVEHVLEVYEWTNTNAEDDDEYPPIGRTCFDVTVEQP